MIHVRQLLTTMLIEPIKTFESFINGQTKSGLTTLEVSWSPSPGIQYKGKTHKDSPKLDEGQRVLLEHSSHFKQGVPVITPNTSGTIIKAWKSQMCCQGRPDSCREGCGQLRTILNKHKMESEQDSAPTLVISAESCLLLNSSKPQSYKSGCKLHYYHHIKYFRFLDWVSSRTCFDTHISSGYMTVVPDLIYDAGNTAAYFFWKVWDSELWERTLPSVHSIFLRFGEPTDPYASELGKWVEKGRSCW